ncbi:hypothetical protein MAR_012410 [Mya arenaria]|uniref:Uncharacterized protein n=1 Tax=Mya arenaria TaxID=6604 RepID=A0ABY7G124_MYAAR|nr:hypothetical protein MAR_012410 [Mya arenaria]
METVVTGSSNNKETGSGNGKGGTVDFAVQKIAENGSMKNIHKASVGDWGGKKVSIQVDKLKVNMSVITTFFKTQIDAIVEHQAIKSRLVSHTIIIPNDADLAVLKEAVIFGHKLELITQRLGSLYVGEAQVEKSYTPATSSKTAICFPVYYTHATDPMYTTDDGCYCAGNMIVLIGGSGLDRSVEVRMIHGGTEIEVEVVTGKFHCLKIGFFS